MELKARMAMNFIDGSPDADERSVWRKAAHGRTAASLHAKSLAALRADSPDLALSLIELAMAEGAIDPIYRCHHAACLKNLGRFARAEKAYWGILREHPQSIAATQGLRALYQALSQCGATPAPARRGRSARHQSARHRHRESASLGQRRK